MNNQASLNNQTNIQQQTLPNGLTIVVEEMNWLPSVSFALLLPFGSATDPAGQEGSATVLSDWLYRGAGEYTSQELSDKLDGLGVRRGGGAGKEYTTFSASLLADSFAEAIALYADVVRKPRLEPQEFEPARSLAQQELASLGDNPTQQLFETLSERYFVSPHGKSSYGSESGLGNLTAESVRADYQRRVAPKGGVLSVAGGIGFNKVWELAQKYFGDWEGAGVAMPNVSIGQPQQEHITQETSQVQIGVAYPATAPDAPGWYENALAIGVLSGGMGARLFTEVREKRGLVYSVAAVSRALRGFGYTLGYAGTTPERADETLHVLLQELRNVSKGISGAEFERSKTGLLSQLIMQGESSGARAGALARDLFLLGTPRSINDVKTKVEAITLNNVNDFLQSYKPSFTILTLGSKPLSQVALS
ncbi:MAG: M16 family metallopeptidase [Trueperaceae bacterium]